MRIFKDVITKNDAFIFNKEMNNPIYIGCNIINKLVQQSNSLFELEHSVIALITSINEKRSYRRNLKTVDKVFNSYRRTRIFRRNNQSTSVHVSIERIGGVHSTPNTFLDIQLQLDSHAWRDSLKPKTSEKHYGIEVELMSKHSMSVICSIANKLNLKGFLSIGSDGSIRPDTSDQYGYEFRLCIPESNLELILAKLQMLLNQIDAKVNKTCGLHVHFDMRDKKDEQIEEIYDNIKKGLFLLKKSIDPLRLTNSYCRFTTSPTARHAKHASTRYRAVNLRSLSKYRTIEIRAFQGTVDTTEMYKYIMLMNKIIETKSPLKRSSSNLKTLKKIYGNDALEFVEAQMKKFNKVA